MRCDLCGGRVARELVSYALFYEGHWIIVEHVPANVCHQCGEKLYNPETVSHLQRIIWSKEKPYKKVETPVFDLAG